MTKNSFVAEVTFKQIEKNELSSIPPDVIRKP